MIIKIIHITKPFKKYLFAFVFSISVISLASCTMMLADAIVNSFPTFNETIDSWPALNDNQGRIVVYYPRQAANNLGGIMSIEMKVDNTYETSIGDRTFVFYDLDAGEHLFYFQKRGEKELRIDVLPKKTCYVEINYNDFNAAAPQVVNETVALEHLNTLHHNYKDPLPVNLQPKNAMRAL